MICIRNLPIWNYYNISEETMSWINDYQIHWYVHTSLWASCQIRKIAVYACAGNAGNIFPAPQVSDPDMHHGACVTHVPRCMPGSLISGFLWSWLRKKSVPGIPWPCATHNFTYLVRGPFQEEDIYAGQDMRAFLHLSWYFERLTDLWVVSLTHWLTSMMSKTTYTTLKMANTFIQTNNLNWCTHMW